MDDFFQTLSDNQISAVTVVANAVGGFFVAGTDVDRRHRTARMWLAIHWWLSACSFLLGGMLNGEEGVKFGINAYVLAELLFIVVALAVHLSLDIFIWRFAGQRETWIRHAALFIAALHILLAILAQYYEDVTYIMGAAGSVEVLLLAWSQRNAHPSATLVFLTYSAVLFPSSFFFFRGEELRDSNWASIRIVLALKLAYLGALRAILIVERPESVLKPSIAAGRRRRRRLNGRPRLPSSRRSIRR
jgi:hypothetical protein